MKYNINNILVSIKKKTEKKLLGDILKPLEKGTITKNDLDIDGKYPVMNSSRDFFGFYNKYNNDTKAVILTSHGANAGFVTFYEGKFWAGSLCFPYEAIDENQTNIKFVYYYMKNYEDFHIEKTVLTGSIPYINKTSLELLPIYLPSIDVQNEIVEVLDKFTMLEAELEAELEARINQYEYFRDELLTFDGSVERKSLRELGELIRGVGLQKTHLLDAGVPAVHYGQIYTYYGTFADKTLSFVSKEYSKKLRKAQKGDILISGVSESIEDICTPVGWFGDEVCISGDMFAFRHNQNTKFITYMLKTTDFSRYKEKYAQGAKVTRLSRDRLLDYKIPVPSLEEQERIVSMLDKFSSLVTDIKEGLPAEIELRRQQYEYYRNKLLTFESED